MKYINLVIDNRSDSTDNFYTYGCEDERIKVGDKVYASFARGNRLREAYAVSFADDVDENMRKKLKFVEKIDEEISLSEEMVRTALWMKGRYLCRYIDGLKCFIPAGSKAKRREVKDLLREEEAEDCGEKELTAEQRAALEKIEAAVDSQKHERFLVHGVTGSGKTELYIRAARRAVDMGRTVIVLVPEISLTGQITERFIGKFGRSSIAILHSKLTQGERYDQWRRIRNGEVSIVIGARSAVFAPLENIGLIIIDEEHETTYKSDHTPKYDTAEVALKRAADKDNRAVLLLGSATPSVVTYSRSEDGIYRLLELTERYNKVSLPKVSVVDMRNELKDGNRTIISNELYRQMREQLQEGRQVMLFLNRRGYYTFISCRECGYVAKCPHCGLSLTYHKATGTAVCHYCGYEERIKSECPECGSRYIRYFGSGTEQAEETVAEIFPEYRTERLDFDSVKKRGELKRKLGDFKKGKTNILIGTQLIAKGLDFKNVGLVGIISADVSLNIPDFRSPERTFQLITQAAGRAGRGDTAGHVVIQTYNPEHYAVMYAAAQDYAGFYREELQLRRFMKNPPYSDLFRIVFSGKEEEAVRLGAEHWYEEITSRMSAEDRTGVFRPQAAYMNRINDTYRYSMLIRCPQGRRREYSEIIAAVKDGERKIKNKKYTAVADINPYSFT